MATKDHSLDSKIIKAAKVEFLEYGYQNASLHKIASNAGLTTGALYTRYKNKDALFCSLVEEVILEYKKIAKPLSEEYMQIMNGGNAQDILNVIKKEMSIYQDLLFSHYDACVLFYCRNQGSSIEKMLNEMKNIKIEQTVNYFKSIQTKDIDINGIGLIISEQFNLFKGILERGYTKEEAINALRIVEIYQEAGWKAVFNNIL